MICPNCRKGAGHAAAGRLARARKAHGKCKGGTWCDCQHKIQPKRKESAR